MRIIDFVDLKTLHYLKKNRSITKSIKYLILEEIEIRTKMKRLSKSKTKNLSS